MQVVHLAAQSPGPAHGILRTAERTVVPRHDRGGMVYQIVIAYGIASPTVCGRQNHPLVRGLRHPGIAFPIENGKPRLLSLEGYYRRQLQTGIRIAARKHRLGGRKIETHGHAAQKTAETPGIKFSDERREPPVGFAAISAVTRKSHGDLKIGRHGNKYSHLARTLQHLTVYFKKSVTMKNTGIAIVSLIGGMIVGSALTMLFTPQSGPELRRHLKDLIDDEIDMMKSKVDEVHEKLDEVRCKCED